MSEATVVSVNVGLPRELVELSGPRPVSGIDKLPAAGPVLATSAGLQGDGVGNTRYHGGTYQAVYAFAEEDLRWWGERLGGSLRPGLFGENLTTRGLDPNGCVLGEQWRVGTARLQVSSVRTLCGTFGRWLAAQRLPGFDEAGWDEQFRLRGRPGVYLSVLEEGWVAEGDVVTVLDRPRHGVTAGTAFRALTSEPALLPLLLEVEGLPPHVYARAQQAAG